MDPLSLMLGVSGLALQLGGTFASIGGSKAASEAQQQQIALEKQAEGIKRQAMEADFRRKSLEVVRRQQQARAIALTNATSKGAGQGSGLPGGYGQISGEAHTNILGLSQAVMSGREMFDVTGQISDTKIAQSKGQQQMQMGSALSSLGGNLLSSINPLRQLTGLNSGSWATPGMGNFMSPGSGSFNSRG